MFSDLEIRKMFDFMLKTFISNHKKSTRRSIDKILFISGRLSWCCTCSLKKIEKRYCQDLWKGLVSCLKLELKVARFVLTEFKSNGCFCSCIKLQYSEGKIIPCASSMLFEVPALKIVCSSFVLCSSKTVEVWKWSSRFLLLNSPHIQCLSEEGFEFI